MAGDWIKLHRKIIESQVFSDAGTLRLWVYLLARANYKTSFFRGQRIEVGQVAFSYRLLSEQLETSVGTITRQLHRLQEWGNITLHAERAFSVATICRWATYQYAIEADGTPTDTRVDTPTDTEVEHKRSANGHVPKKERSLRREEGKKPDSSEPPAASEQPLMEFPTVGRGEKTWGLLPSFVATLSEAFPDLDVLAQCKKARGWCETNAPKRKTPGGMPKFLFGWMERNQNRGGSASNRSGDPRGNLALRERMKEANRAQ